MAGGSDYAARMSGSRKAALGIDIGGTSIKAAVLDGEREVWTGRSAEYAREVSEFLRDGAIDMAVFLRALARARRSGRSSRRPRRG